jgi:PTS system nitrogen regulatory IIA component
MLLELIPGNPLRKLAKGMPWIDQIFQSLRQQVELRWIRRFSFHLPPQSRDIFCKVLRGSIAFLGILDKLNRIFFVIKSICYPVFQGRLMKLSEILEEENIILDLKAKDKKEALEELAESIASRETSLDKGSLVKGLLERERLGSTGIGEGIAIPHGKFYGVSQVMITFGRSREGLDFESIDGKPAFLFFLLVAPENSDGIHLKTLAKLARILKSSSLRKVLMEAPAREELYKAIVQEDEEF